MIDLLKSCVQLTLLPSPRSVAGLWFALTLNKPNARRVFSSGCLLALALNGFVNLVFKESAMTMESKEVAMPVCPYCKVAMRPRHFRGYYESFYMWECDCKKVVGAKEKPGAFT